MSTRRQIQWSPATSSLNPVFPHHATTIPGRHACSLASVPPHRHLRHMLCSVQNVAPKKPAEEIKSISDVVADSQHKVTCRVGDVSFCFQLELYVQRERWLKMFAIFSWSIDMLTFLAKYLLHVSKICISYFQTSRTQQDLTGDYF